MAGQDWQPFGYAIRGPAREILDLDPAKRDRAVANYDVDDDDDSEVCVIETRNDVDEDGNPGTFKKETKVRGVDRARVLLTALVGAEAAETRLTGKGS